MNYETNINLNHKPTNYIYEIIISLILEVFILLQLMYIVEYISYLNRKLTMTAKWSGNSLVFYKNLGRQLVRHRH